MDRAGKNGFSFRGQFERRSTCVCVALDSVDDATAFDGSVVVWLNGSYVVYHCSFGCKAAASQTLKQPELERKKEKEETKQILVGIKNFSPSL